MIADCERADSLVVAARRREARDLAQIMFHLDPGSWRRLGDRELGEDDRVRIVTHWLALRWAVRNGRLAL